MKLNAFAIGLLVAFYSLNSHALNDWANELELIRADVQSPDFTSTKCETRFGDLHSRMLKLTAADIASDQATRDAIRKDSTAWIRKIFDTRQVIRSRVLELQNKGGVSKACLAVTRDLIRAGRVVEDMIGEFAQLDPKITDVTKAKSSKKQGDLLAGKLGKSVREVAGGLIGKGKPADFPNKVLAGEEPWVLKTKPGEAFEFRSGDVLISRGAAFTSAAIARMSDVDAVFSHLGIVRVDPVTKQVTTTEAHIEIGSVVAPIEKYLGDGKTRVVVLRYKDAAVAAKAADRIDQDVKKHLAEKKSNWSYDFSMNLKSDSELFCTELVSVAYDRASNGEVKIPMFHSTINMKNKDFLNRLGISVTESFMPGDIELDPRFEVVAEWRDYSRMHESHMQDAVLTAMYRWMERDGYILGDSAKTVITKNVAWHLRRWPLFSVLLKQKFPKNMSKSVLGVFTTLNEVAAILYERAYDANREHLKTTGSFMSPAQLHDVLEAFRTEDLAVYQADKVNAKFHLRFHPPQSALN